MTSYDMERMSSSREIVVSDRRHSAVSLRDESVTIDETVSYDAALSMHRSALADDLRSVIDSIFSRIPAKRIYLHDEKDYLLDAIYTLKKDEKAPTIFVHREAIQNHLNKLPAILDEILLYSAGGRKIHQELFITWNLRGYIGKLKSLLNRPITRAALDKLSSGKNDLVITLSGEFSYLGMDSSNPVSQRRRNNERKELAQQKAEAQQEKIILQDWLVNISPDLLVAYRETEDIFTEAEALAATPEDEYFLEQVNADYYPHIFESLGKFEGGNADFDVKELVVVESLKQFRIIQLGLQKIIDNAVAQNLTTIKSQTDFLRNKVLGERSFSLTDDEAEVVIDNSIEESQRIREELYKKHVAPKLETNRQEYEASLAAQKTAHEAVLIRERAMHKTDLMDQKAKLQRTYGNEVTKYKNLANDAIRTLNLFETRSREAQKKLQQKHESELSLLRKQYEEHYLAVQNQRPLIKSLRDEIHTLQTSLFAQQEMIDKKQGQGQKEELLHKKSKTPESLNTAKSELHESPFYYNRKELPSYYHKASKDEICEIYEDDEWYDYEF